MPSQASPSPSPPPDAPVASAPGPRAAALQKIFASALSSSIRANTYANFSACFPTPAKYCPSALQGVWQQLNTRLEQECRRDFDQILVERQVVAGLNQWDLLIEDARRRKDRAVAGDAPDRPLHTLAGHELYTAHVTPYLAHATDDLTTKLRANQDHNAGLAATIVAQTAEMERLLAGLEAAVQDIEGSVAAMHAHDPMSLAQIKTDVWHMDQEVEATQRPS